MQEEVDAVRPGTEIVDVDHIAVFFGEGGEGGEGELGSKEMKFRNWAAWRRN
jgi:hypothetical protein